MGVARLSERSASRPGQHRFLLRYANSDALMRTLSASLFALSGT